MADSRERWREFWSAQPTPLNRETSTEDYDVLAAELRVVAGPVVGERVLELGCGDGSLFEPLGFDGSARYLGVELSIPMRQQFAARRPDLDLRAGRGESFHVDERFDLIFSNAVAQFFDRGQLQEHLHNGRAMLADGGRIAVASMPWRRMRWAYARADVIGQPRRVLPVAMAAYLKRRLLDDNMGYWHDYADVSASAAAAELSVAFYGSLRYPYRFHAVFRSV